MTPAEVFLWTLAIAGSIVVVMLAVIIIVAFAVSLKRTIFKRDE